MRSWLVMIAAVACSGCTTFTLEQYTVNQNYSEGRERYREVLHCLAMVAADSSTLPPFSILADGVAKLQDTESLATTTLWNRAVNGFASQNLGVSAARNPNLQWYVSPVADYEKLQALRCACRWVIYGPEHACDDCPNILSDPDQNPGPGFHFGVEGRLRRLPPCWLHVGRHRDIPAHACYKAHCGKTWVWVMPDGLEGLADFTLVFLDIATIDPQAILSPPVLVTLTREYNTGLGQDHLDQGKRAALGFQEIRVIKPECQAVIEEKIKQAIILQAAKEEESAAKEGFLPRNRESKRKNGNKADEGKNGDAQDQPCPVPISWQEWMAYSDPYSGPRASATPLGTSQPRSETNLDHMGRPSLQGSMPLRAYSNIPPAYTIPSGR